MGLTAELLEDNSVAFYETDTENIVFTISAPYMWDATSEYSSDITVSLSSQEGGWFLHRRISDLLL